MPELYLPENKTFDYDDIILVPEKCVVKSRSEVNVTTTLGGRTFALPIIPANMSTIVDENTCVWLAERNIFYVMHRFDINPVQFTKNMQEKGLYASVSLGIKQADYDYIEEFLKEEITPDYITVDVAHGDSDEVHRMVRTLKKKLPDVYVIAGNLATVAGAERMIAAGADAIKIGIGPGCFEGTMLVRTSKGLKKIKDIIVGDEVLTHTGKYQKITNTAVYDAHEEIIEINDIRCTPNHEFYVCYKKDVDNIDEENYKEFCFWVEAQDLNTEIHLSLTIAKTSSLNFNTIIKSKIQPFQGKTYDLEVEEDHSYNIEGTIVHNSACLTAPNTGFGTRFYQLSAVADIAEHYKNDTSIKIIADGGIRHYGDFAKSIAFGADMIMVGGMMAGYSESAGDVIEIDGELKKAFFGSASEHQKGENKHVEGKKLFVPYKGSLEEGLQTIKENLQSSVSYAGGKELLDLRKTKYVIVRK